MTCMAFVILAYLYCTPAAKHMSLIESVFWLLSRDLVSIPDDPADLVGNELPIGR